MLSMTNVKCNGFSNPIGISGENLKFSWIVSSDGNNIIQKSYHIQVSYDKAFSKLAWDSGAIESDNSIAVYYQGIRLKSFTRYYYRIKISDTNGEISDWCDTAFFEIAMTYSSEWSAKYIVAPYFEKDDFKSTVFFRKSFILDKEIDSARVYATALGLYELNINGEKVGNDLLTPGWTKYNDWLQYQAYDITNMLKDGENVVGALVGCGWFKGRLTWFSNTNVYGDRLALLTQLHITYKDGTRQIISSDETWETAPSPLIASELYDGEVYDARKEIVGWNLPGERYKSNYTDWKFCDVLDWPKDILCPQKNEPVRKVNEIKSVTEIVTPKGERVIDFGQNLVGHVKFKVSGKAGDRVVLKHAEVLDAEGNFYTGNLRTAKQEIIYTLKGDLEEVFEAHFSFQGFRYIQIVEYPGEILLSNFSAIVIHSDMKRTGYFSCSNEKLNQLQSNILWGLKGNFVDVPTDCPQRDERLGWTGDAQVFISTAAFLVDCSNFFKKWLKDLALEQLPDGGVPYVIPEVIKQSEGWHSSSGWGDASTICPWQIYRAYGDIDVLNDQFESMKKWVDYIYNLSEDGVIWNSGWHYGDWLGLDAEEGDYVGATDKVFISTAYYAYSTKIVADTAQVLNKQEEYEKYSELYNRIFDAFNKKYIDSNGNLTVNTQTSHAMSLEFGLVKPEGRKQIVKNLVRLISERNWHLTTGFLGTPYLCKALSDNGELETAYKLLLQEDYPSWLYSLSKGATTMWEHWDGIKPDNSMWSVDMNSYNHYA